MQDIGMVLQRSIEVQELRLEHHMEHLLCDVGYEQQSSTLMGGVGELTPTIVSNFVPDDLYSY